MKHLFVAGLTVGQTIAIVLGVAGLIVACINAPGWPATRPRVMGGALAVLVAVVLWALTTS